MKRPSPCRRSVLASRVRSKLHSWPPCAIRSHTPLKSSNAPSWFVASAFFLKRGRIHGRSRISRSIDPPPPGGSPRANKCCRIYRRSRSVSNARIHGGIVLAAGRPSTNPDSAPERFSVTDAHFGRERKRYAARSVKVGSGSVTSFRVTGARITISTPSAQSRQMTRYPRSAKAGLACSARHSGQKKSRSIDTVSTSTVPTGCHERIFSLIARWDSR